MSDPIIRVTSLHKRYRTDRLETTALEGVSFEIQRGEFVAVMGPSGCGKSTLLNVLGLLDRADGGSYQLEGNETVGGSEDHRTGLRKKYIGFIFQSFNLIDELTVRANVELGVYYHGIRGKEASRMADEALEKLGLSARGDHMPSQLSGGQQQRAAIARAIVNRPKLLLADEPTGNLDSRNREEVLEILSTLNAQGSTIVMVTHSDDDASRAGRIVRLRDGQLHASS
ncbi:ABC transporter ATP-binding protein [Tahibacter amnicola]|uniref:ABC transporter ATP-binding protein n=1 Tax=Tahibacter amnicola TaxID=2976241 RepID=A0ABY6BAV1_9GAMM|nr:ABC transporter ATP-binding protein [Tahibacter amnicola]UXI66275.1 ABC transporter ATP-binding protein [Tahibacter amnicola]